MNTTTETRSTQHTPTPWKAVDSHFKHGRHHLTVVDANNGVIFTAQKEYALGVVRAVNSHEATREAMAYAIEILHKIPAFGDTIGNDVSKAQLGVALVRLTQALALARGESEVSK